MARRKLWNELSAEYRRRLRRYGIGPLAHDYLDTDLTEARGHLFTPEHGTYPFVRVFRPGNGRVVGLWRNAPTREA